MTSPEPSTPRQRLVPVVDPMDYSHELSDVREEIGTATEWPEAQFEARYAQMLRRGVVERS